jgi:predicted alpha-1,2-mannosidase
MVQWSPETTRGNATRTPAPGGYAFDATRIRGFSLTHMSGTGCAGAYGDVPFMPIVGPVTTSPSADTTDGVYASTFSHAGERATAGSYAVSLDSGVTAELTVTAHTGSGRFTFPAGQVATMLLRVSSSEVGSSDADVTVDSATRTITGSVTSGNFCGYIPDAAGDRVDRRSYYTLHFVTEFDRAFTSTGTWLNDAVTPGGTSVSGGSPYGPNGFPVPGMGSGAYVSLDTGPGQTVGVRVGISFVSLENARANLRAENPSGTAFERVRERAHGAWSRELGRIEVGGGTPAQLAVFYTALYHSLLHPNLFSDVDGRYPGFDGLVHGLSPGQRAQYANFSGWDVYRSQLQLLTLLEPKVGADIAQSLLNQATQNGGQWDRWTQAAGATHVMTGDPAHSALASILAFGGRRFDARGALASMVQAAEVPTPADLSPAGRPVESTGERPSLDKLLAIHYVPTVSNAWGGAAETLEENASDFGIAQVARAMADGATERRYLARAGWWRNLFNPTATPGAGYIQNRNEDGTFPPFNPASGSGFAEGSGAQYTWMVPFDVRGLFDAMGGPAAGAARLDAFFHEPDGSFALSGAGPLHAAMDNEPSIETPWLYDFAGQPSKTQQTVRAAVTTLWSDAPAGIPGNDDLGEMSSWYVWAAMGMYPEIPGRAELVLASPLFPRTVIKGEGRPAIAISAPAAAAGAPYVTALAVDGATTTRTWLPESFVARGGHVEYHLSSVPSPAWGAGPDDAPPSFPPPAGG